MYKIAKPLFIQCLTPTHVGSGSDIGIVDLPIQREGHTQFPKFEASSLKGALRQRFESISISDDDKVKVHLVFGYDRPQDDKTFRDAFELKYDKEYMGALGITDARLLFFPVKSMKGVYALITSQGVLEKFAAELDMCKDDFSDAAKQSYESLQTEINKFNLTTDGKCYAVSNKLVSNIEIILEEYVFENETAGDVPNLAVISEAIKSLTGVDVSKHLVILQDDDFRDFTELSTEVITRIKIKNSTGVVESGALFTEEYLPTQSILYSLILASPIFQTKPHPFDSSKVTIPQEKAVLDFFEKGLEKAKNTLQIGGNTTLGKGIVNINLLKQ